MIAGLQSGGPMETTFYSLIVIPPDSYRGRKIRISRLAILILAAALVLSFLVTVALMLLFPRVHSSDTDRSRLAAENQTLRVENRNAEIQIWKLNTQISRVEELSSRITALIEAD
jgi:cell division protein FtsB